MFKFAYGDIDFAYKMDKASDPSDDYASHMHYHNEIVFLVSGDVDYHVETQQKHLQRGDLIFIPSGKYHYADVNKNEMYERFVLKFPDTVLPSFLVKKIHKFNNYFSTRKELQTLFTQLDAYFNNFSDEELYILYCCEVTKLVLFLCNDYTERKQQCNDMISSILKYIDEHIQEKISLSILGEELHFSVPYISNEFKKYTKMPLMQYIRTKKIIAAHNMILAGKKKNEVALLFGFADYSTFYRDYVKVMGFAPSSANTSTPPIPEE